jgi:hypothetical protein
MIIFDQLCFASGLTIGLQTTGLQTLGLQTETIPHGQLEELWKQPFKQA